MYFDFSTLKNTARLAKFNHDISHQNIYRVTFKFVSLTPSLFVRASARGLINIEPRLLVEAADPMKNTRVF